jgi:hypothetical protein
MMSLALASLVAATAWPSATHVASSLACEEFAILPLLTLLGHGEMTNWSSLLLELSSEAISSCEASLLMAHLEHIYTRLHNIA